MSETEQGSSGEIPNGGLAAGRGRAKQRGGRLTVGRVYPRGPRPIWWAQFSYNGRRYDESSRSTRRSDAVRLLRRRLGEIAQGKLTGPDAERLTFDDLQSLVLADYRVRGRRSIKRAQIAFKRLEPVFGSYRALDITPDRVLAYIEKRLANEAKPATAMYEISVLRREFTLAFEAGKFPNRPYIPSIEVRNIRTGFFEEGEFRELLKHLAPPLTGLVEFMYLTGWRIGEVLPLEWRQVDFHAGMVRLEPGTTKNDDGRGFPFAVLPRLEAVLRRQKDLTATVERETGRIIPNVFHRDGRPIKEFRDTWKKACKAAGIPNRIPHDFRRTAVRNLERAGVPRSVAMKLTGHKTESVYRRYAIVSEADLKEGVAKLARLHQSQPALVAPKVVPLPNRG